MSAINAAWNSAAQNSGLANLTSNGIGQPPPAVTHASQPLQDAYNAQLRQLAGTTENDPNTVYDARVKVTRAENGFVINFYDRRDSTPRRMVVTSTMEEVHNALLADMAIVRLERK